MHPGKYLTMTIKEAIAIITASGNNLFRVKVTKARLNNPKWVKRWKCTNHNKVHKYIFYTRVSFCAGMEKMYGVDTKEELIKLAKTFIK